MAIYKQTDWLSDNCPVCNSPLPVHSGAGRPNIYCKESCKKKALRAKQKVSRISLQIEKPSRISKRSKKTDLQTAGKHIGVSGTVHKFPLPEATTLQAPAPVIRHFDDLVSFFGG
jgi:hypothetical protein